MYVSHINNVMPHLRISFFNEKIEMNCNYIKASPTLYALSVIHNHVSDCHHPCCSRKPCWAVSEPLLPARLVCWPHSCSQQSYKVFEVVLHSHLQGRQKKSGASRPCSGRPCRHEQNVDLSPDASPLLPVSSHPSHLHTFHFRGRFT